MFDRDWMYKDLDALLSSRGIDTSAEPVMEAMTALLDAAERHPTPDADSEIPQPSQEMLKFFGVEIRNEDYGGARPATLQSALDSAEQAPDDVLAEWLGKADDEGPHADFDRKAVFRELTGLIEVFGGETALTIFYDR